LKKKTSFIFHGKFTRKKRVVPCSTFNGTILHISVTNFLSQYTMNRIIK